jgi:hypothetical protein
MQDMQFLAEELKDLAAEMKPNKILAKEITGIETL